MKEKKNVSFIVMKWFLGNLISRIREDEEEENSIIHLLVFTPNITNG